MSARSSRVVVGAGVVVLLAGGTALATSDWFGSDGQLHACAQKNSGALRLVAEGESCKNDEVAVAWNVQGVQGAQGPQGTQGPAGPPGQAGGVVWKDAVGTKVPVVGQPMTDGGAPGWEVQDDQGVSWAYLPDRNPPVVGALYNPVILLFYASNDCSDAAYADSSDFHQARTATTVGTSEFRALDDHPTITTLTSGSIRYGFSTLAANDGICVPYTDTRSVIAMSSTYAVTLPTFTYVPPLHAELTQ
jgi:hypothetical protein